MDKFRVIEGGGERRDVQQTMMEMGLAARRAARALALAPRQRKNGALMIAAFAFLLHRAMNETRPAQASGIFPHAP